jgi:hypothetical protein
MPRIFDEASLTAGGLCASAVAVAAGYGVQALSTGEGALGSLAKFGDTF